MNKRLKKLIYVWRVSLFFAFLALLILPRALDKTSVVFRYKAISVAASSGVLAFYSGVLVCPSPHPIALIYCGLTQAFNVSYWLGKTLIVQNFVIKNALKTIPEEYRLDNLLKKYGASENDILFCKNLGKKLYKDDPYLFEMLKFSLGDDFIEAFKCYVEVEKHNSKENKD